MLVLSRNEDETKLIRSLDGIVEALLNQTKANQAEPELPSWDELLNERSDIIADNNSKEKITQFYSRNYTISQF